MNGKPHRFLLDTGATHSLIDKSLLKELSHETRVKEIGKGLVHLADGIFITSYTLFRRKSFSLPTEAWANSSSNYGQKNEKE